jgi:hypothetical protein
VTAVQKQLPQAPNANALSSFSQLHIFPTHLFNLLLLFSHFTTATGFALALCPSKWTLQPLQQQPPAAAAAAALIFLVLKTSSSLRVFRAARKREGGQYFLRCSRWMDGLAGFSDSSSGRRRRGIDWRPGKSDESGGSEKANSRPIFIPKSSWMTSNKASLSAGTGFLGFLKDFVGSKKNSNGWQRIKELNEGIKRREKKCQSQRGPSKAILSVAD